MVSEGKKHHELERVEGSIEQMETEMSLKV